MLRRPVPKGRSLAILRAAELAGGNDAKIFSERVSGSVWLFADKTTTAEFGAAHQSDKANIAFIERIIAGGRPRPLRLLP